MKQFNGLGILFILITIVSLSCEPDDICPESTPTTPSLIIRLYDISNQESKKNVSGLRIQGVGNDNVLTNFNVVTTDSIILPLKTDAISTQYKLHKEYTYNDNNTPDDPNDDVIGGNEDIITINYNTQEIFVSRACGYKTIFENVTITLENDGNNWIQFIQPVNDNQSVENETAAHFNLFF
ncbi:DUF6452 family protein [Yeosuana sp.]|uniref:DUF6452 family protein n=1 Tax=Yeosuana sp. TaxID=2529388 RepID=UPI004054D974|tara:strand:+ start:284 stop:826 length:543 start_codon:yes stop_codon:yes gene_type:complete